MNYRALWNIVSEARELIAKLDGAVDAHAPVEDLRRLAEEYMPEYADEIVSVASKLDDAVDALADLAGTDE